MKPRVLIFASGTPTGGGSGFEKLVKATRQDVLEAQIAAVVSQHEHGGARERADRLGVRFIHFPNPQTAEGYRRVVWETGAEFCFLSGWTRRTRGLDSRITINIHPAPLPRFGGKGWYGRRVHEGVLAAYRRGEIRQSAVSMHFADAEYDHGPVFFQQEVEIRDDDTPETLAARVNAVEHRFQARVSDLVVQRRITWDGDNPMSLRIPTFYAIRRPIEWADDTDLIMGHGDITFQEFLHRYC